MIFIMFAKIACVALMA